MFPYWAELESRTESTPVQSSVCMTRLSLLIFQQHTQFNPLSYYSVFSPLTVTTSSRLRAWTLEIPEIPNRPLAVSYLSRQSNFSEPQFPLLENELIECCCGVIWNDSCGVFGTFPQHTESIQYVLSLFLVLMSHMTLCCIYVNRQFTIFIIYVCGSHTLGAFIWPYQVFIRGWT